MTADPKLVRDLFLAAAELPAAERATFLTAQCGDEEVRDAVERLLAAHEQPASVLNRPAPGIPTAYFIPIAEHVGSKIGPYILREQIGEGGFGLVFVADQQEPVKRKVALKVIKPGMDSQQVIARFEAERQALALMDHPNIARVFDAGATESGRPYFVMELVRGIPITDYCDQNHLSPRERLDLFLTVCQAIQHAHQKGIIHRDIKPSNVLVTSHDGKPVAKVIDFGVAKAIHQRLTERTIYTNFAQMIGTPLYMSPEQAEMSGLDIDTRSDIYSLGVLLYELLTGTTPLEKKQVREAACDEIRRLIREEEPPKPSTRLSTSDSIASIAAQRHTEPAKLSKLMRGDLDWITMKALEKDRTRRYETANGLARDIQRYLSDEPVEACPPSTVYRLQKFAKKNRAALATTAAIALLLLVGIAVSTWQAVRATRAQAAAVAARDAEAEARASAIAERDDKEKARAAEAAQRARAERAYARTADVLDTMVSDVTGDSLATQKEVTAEQKKFLSEVLTYYREFAGEKADDEKTRRRTARAAERVGLIEYRLGRREESAAAYRRARDVYTALAAEFPTEPEYRQKLATSHNRLGVLLLDLGKRAEAEEQFRKGLAIQEKLVADFPAVPEYRKDLARSHGNLGVLLASLGQQAEAEEQYREGLAIQEKLAAEFPAVAEYRLELAGSHNNLGALLAHLGQQAEAEEQYRKALAIKEKLAAEFATVPGCRQDLAMSHNNLGTLLADLGKRPEAEEQYRIALAIQEKLAAEFPAVPSYREDLAMSHNNLGNLLRELRKGPEAEEQFRKAMAIFEKLAADFPAVPEYRQKLAMSHGNLGHLLAELVKRPEAEEQYRKAIALFEKLAADFPAVPAYRVGVGDSYYAYGSLVRDRGEMSDSLEWIDKAIRILAPIYEHEPREVKAKEALRNCHWGRAYAHDRLQQYAEAIADWDKAIELSPKQEQPGLRASRAISRIQAGQAAQAVAEVAELARSPTANAAQWHDFACVYAVASGKLVDKKDEYATRALELLRLAVKAGYEDAANLKKDTYLDPLRAREDFKKLLAELEKPADPPEKK